MPQLADMTLLNHAAGNVTFTAMGMKEGVAHWADTSQGSVAGFHTVKEEVRTPNDPSKQITKTVFDIAMPYVDSTTGAVSYVNRVKVEVIVAPQSTLAQKQELVARAKSLVAHSNFSVAVTTGAGQH